VVAILVSCWSLTACLGHGGPSVYAGRDNSSALLIQWTKTGNGGLTGSIQIADKSVDNSGAAMKQTTLTFTGKRESDQVSMSVRQELGQIETWTGVVDGDDFRVNVPQGGSVETLILAHGSADTFDADVTALEAEVLQARKDQAAAEADAQGQADDADADAAARRSFDNAVSDVATSQETLLALLLDPPELKSLGPEIKGARKDFKLVQVNVEEAGQRSVGFVACEFATQAQSAADDVQSDASFVEDNVRAVTQAANDLADARERLSAAYLRLQQLSTHSEQSSKSGSPALDTLIDKARETGLGWRRQAKQAQKTADSIVSRARTLADNAESASC
jgi:hypothetical protein